ncbi:tagaturonate reductase [Paenibacillus glycanilyticus]|uniref:Altronate oxidoreductase n=1 Tax=Paenibacillus glycanilyticus TaxID=126569 RepID=A0ABQ6GA67_9BACL|nr:tagaturonate reductase [Paenibacillus glycanilyticus]GLX67861.1 altronate oxidoreductase [Paenibacillus glycanilyticus]
MSRLTNDLPKLSYANLSEGEASSYDRMKSYPVKVLQIGEGNFLRGFVDWMIHRCNKQGLFEGSVAVSQPRPTGAQKLQELKEQDGLYYQWIRGLYEGELVDRRELISVFSDFIDPYQEWDRFLALAASPDLELVVSNTTEAGLVYQPSEWAPDKPILSYPGKLTLLLYRRFEHFGGDPSKGLLLLPCELVERNGDKLRDIVVQHATDWKLPEAFADWIREHNRFLNSLVDRIVTGFPAEEADERYAEWGMSDRLLNAAEPYHIWAIEGEPELDERLPLAKAGLNVVWTNDLSSYQLRKVRILNGAHTWMAAYGLLNGLSEVREVVEHPVYGEQLRNVIYNEIIPSVPLPEAEMKLYAEQVLERFANPYVRHKLADIAMNSFSKFKVRLLPTLTAYYDRTRELPSLLVQSFASLLAMYRVKQTEQGTYAGCRLDGSTLLIRDDAAVLAELAQLWEKVDNGELSVIELLSDLIGRSSWWGRDLREFDGLLEQLIAEFDRLEEKA